MIQILVTTFSDVYHARFRYLSHSSQISVRCKLDIITNYTSYGFML